MFGKTNLFETFIKMNHIKFKQNILGGIIWAPQRKTFFIYMPTRTTTSMSIHAVCVCALVVCYMNGMDAGEPACLFLPKQRYFSYLLAFSGSRGQGFSRRGTNIVSKLPYRTFFLFLLYRQALDKYECYTLPHYVHISNKEIFKTLVKLMPRTFAHTQIHIYSVSPARTG